MIENSSKKKNTCFHRYDTIKMEDACTCCVESCTGCVLIDENLKNLVKKQRIDQLSNNKSIHSSSNNISEIIFLGSGTSGGLPSISHVMLFDDDLDSLDEDTRKIVEVSKKALIGDPRNNKNYRCNPSILIKYVSKSSGSYNILIDMGKTFRESAIRWFPTHNVQSIDSVVLTHGHADAIFGLDDLRSTRLVNTSPIDVYQSEECEKVTKQVFSYLYSSESIDKQNNRVSRFVSNINWIRINPYEPFYVGGLEMIPIPVKHGDDMLCMGYLFGKTNRVCYLSDISEMIPKTLETIIAYGPINILILDSLHRDKPNPFHINMNQAIDIAKTIHAKTTYTLGMGASIDYDIVSEEMSKQNESGGVDIRLSYDGLKISLILE